MTSMDSFRAVYASYHRGPTYSYEDGQRRVEAAEARFDRALSEYRDAVLSEAIQVLDGEFLTDNTGHPTDEGYNMALHDAQRAIEYLKGGGLNV